MTIIYILNIFLWQRADASQVSGDAMLSKTDIKILLKYGLEISCGMVCIKVFR